MLKLNPSERDHFEERSAIIEYLGNIPRREAERLAYEEVRSKRPATVQGMLELKR